MNNLTEKKFADPNLHFLMRDGEMRARIREYDWSNTVLGEPTCWPASFKTAVALMLDCAGPAYIAWGPHFIQLYNDAYIPILGELKHPQALGLPASETWREIWDIVGPLSTGVLASGNAVWMENKMLPMERNGYVEECYFNFSYSPLTDEAGRIIGIFAMPAETTPQFVSSRRAHAVRMLVQGLSKAEDMHGIRAVFEKTVFECAEDIPFGLWYERQRDGDGLNLVAAAGIQRGSPLSPDVLDPRHDGFYGGLINMDKPEIACRTFDSNMLRWARPQPPRVWPQQLSIKPIYYSSYLRPDGYVVTAINPMRPNDDAQRDFLQTIRLHLENAVQRVNRTDLERRKREYQFHTVMAVLPCLVWMADGSKSCTFVNQTWIEFTGCSLEQIACSCWSQVLHPDDLSEFVRYRNAFDQRATVMLEYRLKHVSGEYRWMLDKAMPRYGFNGEFLGYIGTCIDITDRKQAEQRILLSQAELRTLYDRLQTARTEERYALAREVHDQLGQILSAAKIDIKLLEESIRPAEAPLLREAIVSELQSASTALERAIQVVRRLATELRPPELESQGLPAAIQWHARDFERRTRIPCRVSLDPDMPQLHDVSTVALFGIFQEAMTNILRHAKASQVWICLECRGDRVQLRVLDNGIGIGKERARSIRSIGLKGMRERAALAGGRLVLGPFKLSGTLVAARLPLVVEEDNPADFGIGPVSYAGGAA